MSLDNRLREIISEHFPIAKVTANQTKDSNKAEIIEKMMNVVADRSINTAIVQIKQVFVDEGYINWQTLPKGIYNHTGKSFGQISADKAMTGKEWYSKLAKHLNKYDWSQDEKDSILQAAFEVAEGLDNV